LKLKNNEALWALLDQAAVSGGNFLTSLALARTLTKTEYGTFSLLFLAVLSVNMLHTSLVIYPLTVTVAQSSKDNAQEILGRCIFHTVLLWFGWEVLLIAIMLVLHQTNALVGAGIAMLMWQLQEVARRSLLAEARTQHAILPDAVSYIGQAVLLYFLHIRNLNNIFLCLAATSAAALLWQVWIARPHFHNLFDKAHVSIAWRLGKYTLVANTVNLGVIQLPSWILDAFQGRAIVGTYQTLANLIGMANPVLFRMSTMLIPRRKDCM
jgi:hypothetical protein